jgi:hypothetical protein
LLNFIGLGGGRYPKLVVLGLNPDPIRNPRDERSRSRSVAARQYPGLWYLNLRCVVLVQLERRLQVAIDRQDRYLINQLEAEKDYLTKQL